MRDLSVSAFGAFMKEVYGYLPFPWQSELMRRVATDGRWPDRLDLPTGAGKTAAVDVAVFWMALDALSGPARRAPRRVAFIVDRRVIVDQTSERVRTLQRALASAKPGSICDRVAQRLNALVVGKLEEPLGLAVLRGGTVRDDSWSHSPAQPLVICSTVDQVGSRLLFRGYGVSSKMSSVHAGLFGQDCLLLLDEVHLSQPFRDTLAQLSRHYRTPCAEERWQVVAMSATPGPASEAETVLSLSPDDRVHPELSRRLRARRPAQWVTLKTAATPKSQRAEVARAAIKHAEQLAKRHTSVGVIVNRVDTARAIHRSLQHKLKHTDVVLVTGRMRGLDRQVVQKKLELVRAGREQSVPAVIVATQCIEAGADLDFDALVTESASVDALRQRFGRMNRLGTRPDCEAVILHCPQRKLDPIYGAGMKYTAEVLSGQDDLDFGLQAMDLLLDTLPSVEPLLAPAQPGPILLPTYLELWTQTHPRPHPDPEVACWLHGPDSSPAEVSVIWRSDLLQGRPLSPGDPVDPTVLQLLEACRPSSLEALSLPIYAVASWLRERDVPAISDVLKQEQADTFHRGGRAAIRWDGADTKVIAANQIRPGDTLLVPCAYGGVHPTSHAWDPESVEPVLDIGDQAQWVHRQRAVFRIHNYELAKPTEEQRDDVHAWVHALRESARAAGDPPGWMAEALDALNNATLVPDVALVGRRRADFVSEEGRTSFTQQATTLADHSRHVASWCRAFTESLGLHPDLSQDLVFAGELHDLGKADPRFQQLLASGDPVAAALMDEPLAKSAMGPRDRAGRGRAQAQSGYPRGTRHEIMSLALIQDRAELCARANDWQLVLHLVSSHHGWCRPFPPAVPDPAPVQVAVHSHGVPLQAASNHSLARLDAGVAERFDALNQKYGVHTLAWLEALLRLADHRASEFAGGAQ